MTIETIADAKRSIAIAGNIGVGKSTLVEFLSTTYGIAPFYEPSEDNPYLPDFYKDMKRWAYHSQIYFLGHKFRIHQELDRMPGVVVLDRTIFEDAEIFATALHDMKQIDDRDWLSYCSFYKSILNAIRPPDLMIYLRCSMRTLRKRIRLRGREMEKDVPLSYLKRLDRLYEQWIASYNLSDKLILDTDNLDYIHDLVHRLDVMEKIEAVLPEDIVRPARQR
ncbi:MAG: deoxynucleoside kinase [Woeseia sp.]|nr:deoxynucleoside kinase [Woeseia sp.]MBT8096812.1 deoxynucleoside kinase [Woeseia sp.]